jgi:hypothetical protein
LVAQLNGIRYRAAELWADTPMTVRTLRRWSGR